MSIAPIIARQHKQLVDAFTKAGAVGESNAKPLDEIGIKLNRVLKLHIARKTIVSIGDKYYLDIKYSKLPIEKLLDLFKGKESKE